MKHSINTTLTFVLFSSMFAFGCSASDSTDAAAPRNTSDESKEAYAPLANGETFEKVESSAEPTVGTESVGSTSSALAASGTYDVGVIANGTCPNPVTIYMDDEDIGNNSSRTGWYGTISSQTRLQFCRVDGSAFTGTGWCNAGEYAVLKLGTTCPNGSVELSRYFDNEDTNNRNSNSGNITPSTQSSSGTNLKFCAFTRYPLQKCTASSPIVEFPNVGLSYGVFADTTVYGALQTGSVYTDDEDSGNNDSWDLSQLQSWQVTAVQKFMSGSANTSLKTALVR